MKKITENTPFVNGGESLGMTMLDFWKYQYRNIYDMQEYIAEFIVGKALGINEPMNRDGWTLWDIEYGGKHLEIKESSYYHSWQDKYAGGRISKQRTFSIQPVYSDYKNPNSELKRQSHIYVFCLNIGANAEESYPLDMANWEFYVVPTNVINDNCAPEQKTISLGKVKKLAPRTRYEELKNVIDSICETIKK